MKSLPNRLIVLLSLFVAAAAFPPGRAADPQSANGSGKSNADNANNGNKVDKPDRPPKGGGNDGSNGNSGNSGNPGNSGKNDKNSGVELKSEFKQQADALQKKQKDLLDQLKNSNSDQRAKIREQLVLLKENWKELNREYRDKLDDLKDKADRENSSAGSRAGGRPRN